MSQVGRRRLRRAGRLEGYGRSIPYTAQERGERPPNVQRWPERYTLPNLQEEEEPYQGTGATTLEPHRVLTEQAVVTKTHPRTAWFRTLGNLSKTRVMRGEAQAHPDLQRKRRVRHAMALTVHSKHPCIYFLETVTSYGIL